MRYSQEQAARLAHTARFTEDKKDLVETVADKDVKPEHILKFSGGVPVPKAITGDMGFGISFDYGKKYAMPAGGYFSTAQDLGRLCRMLLRGGELDGRRYLSEKAVRTMSSPQLGDVKATASAFRSSSPTRKARLRAASATAARVARRCGSIRRTASRW